MISRFNSRKAFSCISSINFCLLLFFPLIVDAQTSTEDLLGSAELLPRGVVYGRYEVRMRMVGADGVISSFSSGNRNPVLMMEYGMKLTSRCLDAP